jgi:uncharacterized cupin superfamily protein
MPKIDIAAAPKRVGTAYPAPFDKPCDERARIQLGDAAGLDQFGVNLLTLKPGVWSAQRHWHSHEDEFVWVVEGEVVLIDDAGETVLRAGDCAGFKAGERNGHHLVNRSGRDARVLEIGTRNPAEDGCDYPDIDMVARPDEDIYRHRDGTPYPAKG